MCYTQTLIAQISQSAICNRLHTVEQQMCRFLLFNSDNLRSATFRMTQARISNVLGVRRESVTAAAAQLRDKGLVKYHRGKMELLDRKGLLATVCECYDVVKTQYKRILSKYISEHDA